MIASASLAGIVATFWWFDWRTSLPTPVPAQHRELTRGEVVTLPPALEALAPEGAPMLIHFYNPDCPCSRFNRDQLETLSQKWGGKVRFVVVAESVKPKTQIENPLGDAAPLVLDAESELADALGVFSTPQAVLIAADRTLVYAGNYNTSRYCADPHTEFVRIALESLETPDAPLPELPVWGCQLPAHVAAAEMTP